MPWFPDDAVIRRLPLLAEEEADILAMAPRNLDDRVFGSKRDGRVG